MADLQRLRTARAAQAAEQDRLATTIATHAREIAAERSRLASAQAAGDTARARDAAQRIAALVAEKLDAARGLSAARERNRLDLATLLAEGIALEGDCPLVLLPIRIEVRFTADGNALRVRLFHDALHAEGLDEGLGDDERAAGLAYWRDVWITGDTEAPWPALLAAVGTRRAPWVAEALRPTNLAARPGLPPQFPDTAGRGAGQAVVRTLPDRFFVRVDQDGASPVTVAGHAIPDELPVGITDRDILDPLTLGEDDLPPIDASLRWLVDFDEAQRIGMAVTVALQRPGQPVRRVLAYGVRAAIDPATGAERLARLIRSHSYDDGAEFLAQGVPTNNTDTARSDWSRRTPPGPPRLASESMLDAQSNAAVMARAFGFDPAIVAKLPGARDRQQGRAAAFQTALWTTTWGDAIEHLTPAGRANGDKRLDSPALEAVRDHWVAHVRGRGPLPALRLGRQPYGLLPVVATDGSWRPLREGFVEERLVPFLDQQVRWMWTQGLGNARTVMNEPIETALPFILGTGAVLQGLRVRSALSPEPFFLTAMALSLPDLGNSASGQDVTKALLLLSGVADDAISEGDLLGTKTRALALPLVDEADPAFVKSLLEPGGLPPPATSVLQVLLAHAAEVDRQARDLVATPSMHGLLREAIASNRSDVDRDVVMRAFDAVIEQRPGERRAGVDRLVAEAGAHIDARVGVLDRRTLDDRHPLPAVAPPTLAQRVGGDEIGLERMTGAPGMQIVGEYLRRAAWSGRVTDALAEIAAIESLDERRLLLCETLDCCSHRLDAWITATASRRLADLRASGTAGAFIGAYGWIDDIDLRPADPAAPVDGREVLQDRQDGGYIHAPGLTQAVAAGILRSARLAKLRGDPANEPLDIDLSSARVRDALDLLDGMRRGQALGALLGYRLERRLHERSGDGLELNRFIYVLRGLAPLRAGKLSDPGQPVEESLAASDVVDGLRLMEIPGATVSQKLVEGPIDPRYVPAGGWHPPGPGEAEAVLAAITELDRTHDAVADLLLAESVYQLASGNPARASAALDALAAGESVPPDPEVIRTPRSGLPIQHRLALLIPDPPPPPLPGWDGQAPRALAEPRLERWAQQALGDATGIPVSADGATRLGQAGLCALDVLYDSDGDGAAASTLASRLRASVPSLGDADLVAIEALWELAALLRAALLAGRPLEAADLGRPATAQAQGRRADHQELLARAAAAIDGLKAAAAAGFTEIEFARFGLRAPPGPAPDGVIGRGGEGDGSATREEPVEAAADIARLHEARVAEAVSRVVAAEGLLAQALAAESIRSRIELGSQAIAAVFGGSFLVVPRLSPPPVGEVDPWAGALGPDGVTAKPGAEIRPWLQRAGALRTVTGAYGETVLAREARGRRPRLRVFQTPAGAHSRWIGLPFGNDPPTVPLASMVAEYVVSEEATPLDPPPDPLAGVLAGVVLDEWIEVLPRRLLRRDRHDAEAAPTWVDVTTTGLAVNANGPGARPPQAILFALTPDGGDWTDERLVKVIEETSTLAKMRTLTLQQIPFVGRMLPALYFRDWSLQGEPVIDWGQVATRFDASNLQKFLAVDD